MSLDDLLSEPFQYPTRDVVDGLVDEAMACLPPSRRDLTSRVSHAIRTPLAAILGFKEVLEMDQVITAEERSSYEAIIRSETIRLQRFIETLKVLQASMSGQLPLVRSDGDLRDTISTAVERCRMDAQTKMIRLSVIPMRAAVHMSADHRRLGLAFEHLLTNALRATPKEGVVDIELVEHGAAVSVTVEDSGYGIHKNEADRLFKPFQRIPRPDDNGGELGLGLTIVRTIVERHQGSVTIDSSPMNGARVTVRLQR